MLPARLTSLEREVARALRAVRQATAPQDKFRLLISLKETNRRCFYALLQQHLEEMLPLVYTPTIGDACMQWGTLMLRPPGLYVSLEDLGRVDELVQHWPQVPLTAREGAWCGSLCCC